MTRRWLAGAVITASTPALVAACGFQQKTEATRRIIRSSSVVASAGTATGHIELLAKVTRINGQPVRSISTRGGLPAAGSAAGGASRVGGTGGAGPGDAAQAGGLGREQASPPFRLDLDFLQDRASIVLHPGALISGTSAGTDRPLAVYSHWSIYRYNPPANLPAQPSPSAAPTDEDTQVEVPRVWLKLDFGSVDSNARAVLQELNGFPSVSPLLLLRLLKGALTGSVTSLGPETVDGTPTTHYRFNIDRDKALQGMRDRDKQVVALVLQRSGFAGTVYRRAEVWLDDQGRARRFLVRFHQVVGLRDAADIAFRVTLTSFGTPVAIDVPSSDATATVADYPQLVAHA